MGEGIEIYSNRSAYQLSNKLYNSLKKYNSVYTKPKKVLVRQGKEQFACGEFKVKLPGSVRGKKIFLLQCPIDKTSDRTVQDNLWETLLTLDALKHCHAKSITLVMPLLAYSRQDKRDGREPLSARLFAEFIGKAGADSFITFDIHSSQVKGYFEASDIKCDSLYATNIFVDYIKSHYQLEDLVVLAPDQGGTKRAYYYASKLFKHPHKHIIFAVKKRSTKQIAKVDLTKILGNVENKTVLLVDDIADTLSTIDPIIQALHKKNAKEVIVCCTHAILSDPASQKLNKLYTNSPFTTFLTTNTVPHQEIFINNNPWFMQLDISPMLAKLINRIIKNKPTSSLYL
ncbi:MAG: Ribose-phosphate pyrophosphokinase [Candidatus Woesearchaeota archaeon]|nr:Ribose-phosphate pyrophosphokinase [Candidatus Woesearchaeota archaeon]